MKLKIMKSAFEVMEKASLGCETETGGLVLGTTNIPLGIRATTAGRRAVLSHSSYANDSVHDNGIMRQIMSEFDGRVKLIGYWHKHPGNMSCPSSGDLATARDVKQRIKDEGDFRPVFFVITNVIENKVKLFCYVLERGKDFVAVPVEVVNDDSDEVAEALDAEPRVIQTVEMDFWKDPDFQFYRTARGNDRLYHEIAGLRGRGCEVRAYARDELHLVVRKGSVTWTWVLPPEYPLNPPRLFKDGKEVRYVLPMWNSTFSIAGILADLGEVGKERSRNEGHPSKAVAGFAKLVSRVRETIESLWPRKKK